MDCRTAQSKITPFIDNKLKLEELEEFINHVNSCKECHEELEVYYALLTAMKQLNEERNLSDNFSLDLKNKLERAQERILHVKYVYYRKKVVLILAMIFMAFFLGLGYANKSIHVDPGATYSKHRIRHEFKYRNDDWIDYELQLYLNEIGGLN